MQTLSTSSEPAAPVDAPDFIPVVAAALVRADGKVLMQQRPLGKMHAGLWEYPGGKVEAGETPEAALVREIAEELGLSLAVADLEPCAFASSGGIAAGPIPYGELQGGKAAPRILLLLYVCRKWSGEPRNLDAQTIAWFEASELANLEMPPLDVPLTKSLIEVMKRLAKFELPSY